MLLIYLFIIQSITAQSESYNCKSHSYVGILCTKKDYEPADIISPGSSRSVDINFISIKNKMHLKIPENYSSESLAEYKSFVITESCVGDIEDNYFQRLDKGKNILKKIKFSKVKCLRTLETRPFFGIGSSIEYLYFDFMQDLIKIEEDFFNTFSSLKKLIITNTGLTSIPEKVLTFLPNLMYFIINNNQLTTFPFIPTAKLALGSNIQGYGNPFHCNCSIMEFISKMREIIQLSDYKCFTPLSLKDKHFSEVEDLCFTTTFQTQVLKNESSVVKANIRIEIIISVAISLLLIVIIIFIIIICKQKRKKSPEKVFYNGSPSKIIFQKYDYSEPLFQRKDDMI